MFEVKRIDSSEGTVAKFVFTKPDAVVESVLYRYPTYEQRTVICCSTMSGCPVGCTFCGTGKYFVRNLTGDEIVEQVEHSLSQTGVDPLTIQRLQIMVMSMGEPLLNRHGLMAAFRTMYGRYPNARLLISTSAPAIDYGWVHDLSREVPTVGLQFSIHESTDAARNRLIPFEKKLDLLGIAEQGRAWHEAVGDGRRPFFNYCTHDGNASADDADRLVRLFDPSVWEATISVICEKDKDVSREAAARDRALDFSGLLVERGFNTRVFDPAGQDDIGGGCGQLWFVQDWFKSNPDHAKPSSGFRAQVAHAD